MWPEFPPGTAMPILLTAVLYAIGSRRSSQQSRLSIVSFWAGWSLLAIALLSPLHELGEELFSAHMVQHEILMVCAAPLLVFSRPLVPFLWGLPYGWRRGLGKFSKTLPVRGTWHFLTRPSVSWPVHAVALWLWHAPALFQATLTHEWVHALQHISFLGSALLFWWSLLGSQKRLSSGAGILYLFTTGVHTSILGALLTFAPAPWYPAYAATAPKWGLTALEDQQIGGLIMWVPAGIVYVAAGLAILAVMLRSSPSSLAANQYAE
jgi:putative membrane protein